MTVMSEGLLLNSNLLKWHSRRGFFKLYSPSYLLELFAFELIIWRLTIYGSAMVCNVGAVCHVKPSR